MGLTSSLSAVFDYTSTFKKYLGLFTSNDTITLDESVYERIERIFENTRCPVCLKIPTSVIFQVKQFYSQFLGNIDLLDFLLND